MIANMAHGGRIAVLGLPSREVALDWNHIITNMLTIRGIYGREMYETWYQMTVMVQSGLDISPVITHRFPFQEHEQAFAVAALGSGRQGDPGLARRHDRRPALGACLRDRRAALEPASTRRSGCSRRRRARTSRSRGAGA